MNEKELIYDVLMLAHDNRDKSYKKIVNIILSKYQQEFRDPEFFVDLSNITITDTTWLFLKYSPFQFSFNSDDIHNRRELYNQIQKIITPNDNELISIGTGYIGGGGVMAIGMAPGFYTGDADDLISQPFKPSFFFQNTSELLRSGLGKNLAKIYFTNASKIAIEKKLMNESYEAMYEKYWHSLEHEINLLQPEKVLAIGANVYKFLCDKGIQCEKVYHPSYFIYRHQVDYGVRYYENIFKE